MTISEFIRHLTLTPVDNRRLNTLCGPYDEHLSMIERDLGVEINNRGNRFEIIGIPSTVDMACTLIDQLYTLTATEEKTLSRERIQQQLRTLQATQQDINTQQILKKLAATSLQLEKTTINPRTSNQRHYLNALQKYAINFGVGPSGTGKTFLAVASAVHALEQSAVSRIVLVRPAVEAGERLGFLPGDLAEKIDPYLRPLYDALYEMLGVSKTTKLITKGVIEIAPLAFMRGRTLNDSYIILDEGQNSTREQMKMFLTRIGFGSKAVITGDITQVDLPNKTISGLRHAIALLKAIDDIHFTFFTSEDVVRHPIVQQIVEAYEQEQDTS